jgi:rubrerythrin
MEDEQARTTKVLELAVQMETDGKEFYQRASRKSGNRLAKDLFRQLADEEDIHRSKFEEIYKAIKKGKNWPDVIPASEKGKKLKSLFSEATKALGSTFRIAETELEAIKTAMDMEIRSYNLYHSRSKEATLPVEKRFYETLAGEERGHHLALVGSYEYLSDPAGWFTQKEHWSLDGA